MTATLGRERSYTNRADVAFRLVELAVSSPHVQPQTLVRVIAWLFNLPEGLQNPFVAVGDDGSISTEWDVGGSSLHVTFDDETEEVYFVSPDGEEWESTLDAVDKLSSGCARSRSQPRREGDASRVGGRRTAEAGETIQAIDDSVRALRLVKAEWVKVDLSPRIPSSQAFQDRRESGAMSVYMEDELRAVGRSLEDLRKRWEGYWIFSLTVGQLKNEFGQDAPSRSAARLPGHGLVRDPTGKRSQGKRSRMAASCELVCGPYEETAPGEEAARNQTADSLSGGTHDGAGLGFLLRVLRKLRSMIRA